MLLAAAAVTGSVIRGPRMLDEGEIQSRRRRPLPRVFTAIGA
jgi:hypothetical protein